MIFVYYISYVDEKVMFILLVGGIGFGWNRENGWQQK